MLFLEGKSLPGVVVGSEITPDRSYEDQYSIYDEISCMAKTVIVAAPRV